MTQREAVYKVIQSVVDVVPGTPVELSTAQKKDIHETLIAMFLAGEVEYRGTVDETTIRKYVPGLVNNWVRKDTRLNGGVKYVPKNPGSRLGSGDEALKAMRSLLAATQDPDARKEIEAAIELRKAELKPKVEINVTALPEHLRHLVPQA